MSLQSTRWRLVLSMALLFTGIVLTATASVAENRTPSGRVVMAWHVTIPPSWFDPSTAPPQITPFGMLYAIHDALVRPYPGQKMGPSLAESWTESEDGLIYEFRLRPDLKFHNGDRLTTEDVKFSFERYSGAAAKTLHEHVTQVEIVDPQVVRFHLGTPWPDFMTFFGTTASAAGIVLPKHYLTEVGDDGFKKHPIGAGPYKFVSGKPGIEVRARGISRLLATRAECENAGDAQCSGSHHAGADGAGPARPISALRSTGPMPRGCRRQGFRSWRRSMPRSSGSSSPGNGTRSRRGTTSGCDWR